jgi:flavin-dependent dehydrogenase
MIQGTRSERGEIEKGSRAPDYDVVVMGAGMGGLAACLFLRHLGLRVVCIEPEPFPHARVGESLDFATPRLLDALGMSPEQLFNDQIATHKRSIKVLPLGTAGFGLRTRNWLARKPLQFEVQTLHVDRAALDQRMYELSLARGVVFLWDRVSSVEATARQITACRTASNQRITANWFIDSSGQTQLLGKTFQLPRVEYGPQKVCFWTYFDAARRYDGTTFYVDPADQYLTWIWEIPITPHRISVGWIVPADQLKGRRRNGKTVAEILREELVRHPKLALLSAEQPGFQVQTCAFRNYTYRRACGPNWLMVGESASVPDPLTGNGVTSALRHAQEAVRLIQGSLARGFLSTRQQAAYNSRVRRLGDAFNFSIESCVYQSPVRWGLGLSFAVKAYIAGGFFLNALFSRLRPRSRLALTLFGPLLTNWQVWMAVWAWVGRGALQWQRLAFAGRSLLSGHRIGAPRSSTPLTDDRTAQKDT